jgi:hypothetical protein
MMEDEWRILMTEYYVKLEGSFEDCCLFGMGEAIFKDLQALEAYDSGVRVHEESMHKRNEMH